LHGALGKETFLKKIKTVCADGLCQVCSAHDFLKKIEKQPLSTAFAKGFRHRFFLKKNLPLCRRPKLEAVGKDDFKNRQLNPPLTASFYGRWPTVGSRHILCREPRARVLGKEPWPRKNSL
jgi:hypothetical protein